MWEVSEGFVAKWPAHRHGVARLTRHTDVADVISMGDSLSQRAPTMSMSE
jgi:hypothetical protein